MTNQHSNTIIPQVQLAPIGIRAIHFIIDSFILSLFSNSLIAILHLEIPPAQFAKLLEGNNINNVWTVMKNQILISYALQFVYYFPLEYFGKATFGKLATKSVVIRSDGKPCTAWDILFRTFCRCIPFNAVSFIWALATNKKIGWHDSISNTRVVNKDFYKNAIQQQQSSDIN